MLWRLAPREGNGMRCTKGSTANTVRMVSVILTELDSSSHTYKIICVINEIVPAMSENTPAIIFFVMREARIEKRMCALTMPHDPYPRALGPIALQEV